MGEKVNLVRDNGQVISVNKADADLLRRTFGYKDEGRDESSAKSFEKVKTEYYSNQKLATFGEGVASGATFGLSDVLLDVSGADTSDRARYNPKSRLAGEITGMIGSSAVGVGPVGFASKGAATLAKGASTGGKLGIAALEGAALGGGTAISQAALSDEPMTVEAALGHMGVGAVLGLGTQALGHTLESAGKRIVSRVNAGKAAALGEQRAAYASAAGAVDDKLAAKATEKFNRTISKLDSDAAKWAEKEAARVATANSTATRAYEKAVKGSSFLDPQDWSAAHRAASKVSKELAEDVAATRGKWEEALFIEPATSALGKSKGQFREMLKATSTKELDAAVAKASNYASGLGKLEKLDVLENVKRLGEEVRTGLVKSDVAAAMKHLPENPASIGRMTTGQIEQFAASLAKQSTEVQAPVIAALRNSGLAVNSVDDVGKTLLGLKKLRVTGEKVAKPELLVAKPLPAHLSEEARTFAREQFKLTSTKAPSSAVMPPGGQVKAAGRRGPEGTPWGLAGLLRQKSMSNPAAAGGLTAVGVLSGNDTLRNAGLFGLVMAARGNVRKTLVDSSGILGKKLQGAGRTIARTKRPVINLFTPMVFPEYRERPRTRGEAARMAIEEVNALADGIENTANASVQEASTDHPEWTLGVEKFLTKAVKWLQEQAPKNPGTVVVGGRDVWQPSEVQARKFQEQRQVAMDPTGSAQAFLSGDMSFHAIEAFKTLWPEMHYELSEALIEDHNIEDLDHNERNILAQVTGQVIDASRTPEKIARWQSIHLAVNQTGKAAETPTNQKPQSTGMSTGKPPNLTAGQEFQT